MRHVQLKRTVFRSLAPSVGVKGPAAPRPAPPPPPPPARPGGVGPPRPGACGAAPPGACGAAPAGACGAWPWTSWDITGLDATRRASTPMARVRLSHMANSGIQLFDVELEILVTERETPNVSRRVAVDGRKDGHLERVARLDRALAEPLSRQSGDGSGGQRPVH